MPYWPLLSKLVSDSVIDQAYSWLCRQRKHYSWNNDIWSLKRCWANIKPVLQTTLAGGRYRFEPVHRIPENPHQVALWTSQDALVLKALTIVLTEHLVPRLPAKCYHLLGNGGSKRAVCDVADQIPHNTFVFRCDAARYYASIRHEILLTQLAGLIDEAPVLDLIAQYLRRTVYDAGRYQDVRQGIPLACPLSPLMSGVYLTPLDWAMQNVPLIYVRFVDDWLVLARKRWQLRSAIRTVNQVLSSLQLVQAPDKTFVGRIAAGFDFLGYRFNANGIVSIADRARNNCAAQIDQLYEQDMQLLRVGEYVRRWLIWGRSGLQGRMSSAEINASLTDAPPF